MLQVGQVLEEAAGAHLKLGKRNGGAPEPRKKSGMRVRKLNESCTEEKLTPHRASKLTSEGENDGALEEQEAPHSRRMPSGADFYVASAGGAAADRDPATELDGRISYGSSSPPPTVRFSGGSRRALERRNRLIQSTKPPLLDGKWPASRSNHMEVFCKVRRCRQIGGCP